jgi:uncharacterized protein with HEPN domain
MSTDRLHLIHCEERLRRIEKYTEGGRSAFMASRMHQDAVLWNLQMICLCGKRVSEVERESHKHVDWDRLCNLCQGVVNSEMTADTERVWEIVEAHVPALQHQLRLLLTAKV